MSQGIIPLEEICYRTELRMMRVMEVSWPSTIRGSGLFPLPSPDLNWVPVQIRGHRAPSLLGSDTPEWPGPVLEPGDEAVRLPPGSLQPIWIASALA